MSQEVVRLSKIPHEVSANMRNSEKNSATPAVDSSNKSVIDGQSTNSVKCSTVNGAVS